MLLPSILTLALSLHTAIAFNPREYTKSKASCKAIKRDANNAIVDITISTSFLPILVSTYLLMNCGNSVCGYQPYSEKDRHYGSWMAFPLEYMETPD